MSKTSFAFLSAACGLLLAGCDPNAPLYRAETAPDAPIYERTAALELTNYVARVVTNRFTVGGKSGIVFHVGDTAFARQRGIEAKAMADEAWKIKSFGPDIVLVGGGTRGTIYAVAHFLEDHLDIHWWSEGTEYVPAAKAVDLAALDEGGKPYFLEREIFQSVDTAMRSNAVRMAWFNRLNGGRGRKDLGGSFEWGPPGGCHTFGYYVPFNDEMKKKHLDWFSLVGGKRQGGIASGQLCLSAPGLADYMYVRLLKYIAEGDAKADKAGLPRPVLYDLSMCDRPNGCTCPKCKEQVAKWGWSGQLVRFLNGIAEKVAKVRPEIYITTLAYHYNEAPPKDGVKVADNVIIRLCDTRSSMAGSPFDKDNGGLLKNIRGWNRCAKNIFIWDYAICYAFGGVANGCPLPCAGERHYGELYRMFRDNGVKGVFVEQEDRPVGDFDALKYFLQAKLMEDPRADADALTRLFMDRYYGAAAGLVYDYRADLDRIRKARNGYITWEPGLASYAFIRDEDVVRYQKLFDEAEALVKDDPERFARVRHARNGLDALVVERARVQTVYHGPALPVPDATASLQRLRTDWPAWFRVSGSRLYGYGRAINSITNDLPTNAVLRLPPPPEFKGRRFYDFYPSDKAGGRPDGIYGGDFVVDKDSPSGMARRLKTDKDERNFYGLPFVVGYYNLSGKGISGVKGLAKPEGKGYHWYKFQVGEMPPSEWIYMTRGWHLGLRKGLSALTGQTLETWVSLKFEGPRYFPDDPGEKGKENAISVGRMVFAEPK